MSELIPDFTFFIQIGIFLACYAVLNVFVFKPYLALLRAREAKTVGLREEAAKNVEKAESLKSQYDTFMKAERKKLASWTDEQRRHIGDEERKLLQRAREEVGAELQSLRSKLKTESERAREALVPLIPEYSSSIATKLVGYQVKVPASAVRDKSGEAEQVV